MSTKIYRLSNYCTDPLRVEEAISGWLELHQLLHGVERLGLAVSGGADSVALFHLMLPICRERGIKTTILHLNHGLRQEAASEAEFVQTLAQQAGIDCRCAKVSLARRLPDGRSLEMAARDARLTFMNSCARELELNAIATGHQADDVAEGLLLRLARGAGTSGLSALRPCSPMPSAPGSDVAAECEQTEQKPNFIRPLLIVSGSALRAWLNDRKLAWHEDASNRDLTIPRNLVRHALLPQLEKIWPVNIRARLCQSADILREDEKLLSELADETLSRLSSGKPPNAILPVSGLTALAPALQRRVLRTWMFAQGIANATGLEPVQAVLNRCCYEDNWQQTLPGLTIIQCRKQHLSIVQPKKSPPAPIELFVPTETQLCWGDLNITLTMTHGIDTLSNGTACYPARCSLNAEVLKNRRLVIRSRQAGDRIAPTGMDGTKKIQELFIDAKIPETLRDHIPIFACDHEVVWIPGYRISRHFSVPAPDAPSLGIAITLST